MKKKNFTHPYIPNSAPDTRKKMLAEIGVESVEELYSDLPEEIRFKRELDLPAPLKSEMDLKEHVKDILAENKTAEEYISFLGGGCYNHYVPAIVDEIMGRSEFLTAYAGEPYEDHGRFQALFEYQSLMAELLNFDVVNVPTFDYTQASATSIRMTGRITKSDKALVAGNVSSDRFSGIKNYCEPVMEVISIAGDPETGQIDIKSIEDQIDSNTACIYFENPNYLGIIETAGEKLASLAHSHDALLVVGVDPSTLGVLETPANYGADIACGDVQTLGLHPGFGGNSGGFIATHNKKEFVMEYPSRIFGISKTAQEGEWGFGDVAYDRTSFGEREKGREFVGTAAALNAIGAAVYLSLMGADGLSQLGKHIVQKTQYLAGKLTAIDGISLKFSSPHFKEIVVDFSATELAVPSINARLLDKNIFGGKDLSNECQSLDNCALFCVTEMVSKEDIDTLVNELKEIINNGVNNAK